ncbi:MAG: SCP2 sterol-binding domain-containing protein [Lachnospiraceae bacterium]|nr:SCP2 sterol-binding domain-containing protein [Lachnospiraceae bacterium]
MKINIYYGGRGLVDDPTALVLDKMEAVFSELNVSVERFNLYELRGALTTLPQTLKSADGIILATTLEWFGIGGYMQTFLDAIWLYGDKEKISQIYMCPVVMSTTYGEKEAKLSLANAWEILGGLPCSGMSGYIKDTAILEHNPEYQTLIEKKAENMYRTIRQKVKPLPASNQAVKQTVTISKGMNLTPQESEQLSRYASDEAYVQKQKADIKELTALFGDKLGEQKKSTVQTGRSPDYDARFQRGFFAKPGGKGTFVLYIDNGPVPVISLHVQPSGLTVFTQEGGKFDVKLQMDNKVLEDILEGRSSFQKAFMTGSIKMKGDFAQFRILDEVFNFQK